MFFRLRQLLHHLNPAKATTINTSRSACTMSSTGPEIHNTNVACCSIPPVEHDYTPKGEYTEVVEDFLGFKKTYTIGPKDATTYVIAVFDIFGYFPQTFQGADSLAKNLNARLVMPDFFDGKPFPISEFPPDTPEKQAALQGFFGGAADFSVTLPKLLNASKIVREQYGAKTVVAYGLCWGGKLTIKAGSQTIEVGGKVIPAFDAVAAIHPAMLDAADADGLLVPIGLFPSKDEPLDKYDAMVKTLNDKPYATKNVYKVYPNMIHGFAGARGDLKDEETKKEFADVYGRLATFFKEAENYNTAAQ